MVNDEEGTDTCVPCGYLGYPIPTYGCQNKVEVAYNTHLDTSIKTKRQYFGFSNITGIDYDLFSYKGVLTDETHEPTAGFHMDAIVSVLGNKVWINGKAYDFESVDTKSEHGYAIPRITTEKGMEDTIYEDVRLRKFTVYPCGGFDGWDIYRKARTNTNEFKANKYKGTISNGEGATFSTITNGEGLALSGNCITSDYYAYLAGINQFENPERVEINLFATPGIDYVNNEFLVNDAIDMVENRLDTFYVPTTPDKPYGAGDGEDEMYSSKEVADNLSDTNVDTYYAATYYPWVKYFDRQNNI